MKNTLLVAEKAGDKFNIAIVGNKGVGKTSLIKKLMEMDNYQSIPDNSSKSSLISSCYEKEYSYEDKKHLFKFWDTSSNEDEFKKYYHPVIRKADTVIMLCASDDKGSFNDLDKWYKHIKNIGTNTKIFLINNKVDLDEDREIGLDELKQKSEKLKIKFNEISVKSGSGIKIAFEEIFKGTILSSYAEENVQITMEQFNVGENTPNIKNKCPCSCNII